MSAVTKGCAARVTRVTICAPRQASAAEAHATASIPNSSRAFLAKSSRDSARGLWICSRSIERTASIVPTWASACLPVPASAMTFASLVAIQSAATPEIPPVRRLPSAKASITAASDPSSALHRRSSGQVPPWVWVHVFVPTRLPSFAPIACRLFLPYCSSVFVMFCASPRASSLRAPSSAAMASFRSRSWTTSASVIQIASAMSDLERSEHLRGKQVLERELAVTHALLEGEVDERLQRLAVLLEPVGPEVVAEEPLHALRVRSEPREGGMRRGDVREALDRAPLRIVESLVEIHREPGMALEHVRLDRDHVHDGENARLLEIRLLGRFVVGKEPPDSLAEVLRGTRRQHRVELAREQHVVERAAGLGLQPHSGRQLELHFLYAARLVHPRLDPVHRVERHARLVREKAARVDDRGLRPFGNADALALQLLGSREIAPLADVDHRVPERARREHGDRGDACVALRAQRHVLAHGHLRHFPLAEMGEAEERFLRRQCEHVQRRALHGHGSRGEVARVLVVADRERQRHFVHRYSFSSTAPFSTLTA